MDEGNEILLCQVECRSESKTTEVQVIGSGSLGITGLPFLKLYFLQTLMITCGHFDRACSDQSMLDLGGPYQIVKDWKYWRPTSQKTKNDIVVVQGVQEKWKFDREVVNPTQDPVMVYRGIYQTYLYNILYNGWDIRDI